MDSEIIIVSGLPRSGTSLMMQMLDTGGLEVVTDNVRTADTDNPRGYYEYEQVKKIKEDASWLPATRGKAFKMVSQLLYDLPPTEKYRVIFMERDLDEILASQEKMLQRLGRKAAPREQMKRSFNIHLQKLHEWLPRQRHLEVLRVRYAELVQRPEVEAERINQFLAGKASVDKMAKSVDTSLYRNRKTLSERSANPFADNYHPASPQLILWWDI
jgi:sulfotransferase family protein